MTHSVKILSLKLVAPLTALLLIHPAARAANRQPAILTTVSSSNTAVVFPDAEGAPSNQKLPPLPPNSYPHGVSYYGRDNALVADYTNSRIFVIEISTGSLLDTIDTSAAGYDGSGTLAVAPSLTSALAMGDSAKLNVIHAPFTAGSTITKVPLPGKILDLETQAIVFNNAGRAFVETTAGISVLDPPYTAVAFTMPPVQGATNGGALAITPDGNTLLATAFASQVRIYHAPYARASIPELVTIPGNSGLDGIAITPDGSKAIVVTSSFDVTPRAAVISAPFTADSTVEALRLPVGTGGLEDVGMSADGKLAILEGNGSVEGHPEEQAIFVRAPFTAAGATSFYVPIQGVADPNRGNGAARFLPPGLAPGLTISATAPASVALGAKLTYTITYANTGSVPATKVVINVPLPSGTVFVSATGGGKLKSSNIFFTPGNLSPGANKTVTLTVTVAAPHGGTISNYNYTIAASGVAPIAGPPVDVAVTGASGAPARLLNISTRLNVLGGDNVLIGGFIITGNSPKKVIVRGLGPSLEALGVSGALADPVLELHQPDGSVVTNNNWKDTQRAAIQATTIAPKNDLESAIVATLAPGAYTAVLRGNNGGTGVGLVDAYDLDSAANSQLANISTRGFVSTGENVLIGGFIVGQAGGGDAIVVARAIGPSLAAGGVTGALKDPTLELHNGDGDIIASNDNWRDHQEAQIITDGIAPTNDLESALEITLPPGNYTAIVRGVKSGTGIGLVEVYNLR